MPTGYEWGGGNNYWDSTYGRGIGGPNATAPTQGTTNYVPPSAGTQQAQNSTTQNNTSASDWWDMARFAYGVWKDRNPKEPEFKDVPLSPEQRQMYQIYIQSMLNPSTVNNASALNKIAQEQLGGLSGMKWQSPRTFSGDQGYGGSSLAFTPPQVGPGSGSGAWPGSGGSGGGFFDPDSARPGAEAPRWPMTGGGAGSDPFGGSMGAPDYYGGRYGGFGDMPTTGTAPDMMDMVKKFAGAFNPDQETWEKYLSRGASIIAGFFGFPIPPQLIDKGIDGLQWLWRKLSGGNGPTADQPGEPGGAPLGDRGMGRNPIGDYGDGGWGGFGSGSETGGWPSDGFFGSDPNRNNRNDDGGFRFFPPTGTPGDTNGGYGGGSFGGGSNPWPDIGTDNGGSAGSGFSTFFLKTQPPYRRGY